MTRKTATAKKDEDVAAPAEKFHTMKREVFELGASGMSKRAKKVFEDEKLRAFGGAVANPKMPFKMLLGIRKAEKLRAKRAEEERRASGVVGPATTKLDNVLRAVKPKKRKRQNDVPVDDVRDGVLRVGHHLRKSGSAGSGGGGGGKRKKKRR
mmetsp:Transcript_19721/g.61024  ORF Transcript_19721/g.61024 Transcript_19721/m.61024 type:complete len:153 (-) Transcript_19721:132-590(-)